MLLAVQRHLGPHAPDPPPLSLPQVILGLIRPDPPPLSVPQVILGFIRPTPTASIRTYWNLAHHNLGRVTVLSAWTTVYLGIYIAHGSPTYELEYNQWLVPVAVVMGCMVLADIVLSILK